MNDSQIDTLGIFVFIIMFIIVMVTFPRFRKFMLAYVFVGARFLDDKAEIQIKQNGRWVTVQRVQDIQDIILYAFDDAVNRYSGTQVIPKAPRPDSRGISFKLLL